MKKIIYVRLNQTIGNQVELNLARLKSALEKLGVIGEYRSYKVKFDPENPYQEFWFSKQVAKQKKKDEIYISTNLISTADIYIASDGVRQLYEKTKKFWYLSFKNFINFRLEKKCLQNAKLIITQSQMVKRQIIDNFDIREKNISVIPNGINLPKSVQKAEAKTEFCDKFGFDIEIPIILFVANDFEKEGLEAFLKILSQLTNKYNAIVIGDDIELNKYKNLAKKLGVSVAFMGEQRNISKFYEASDLFLYPVVYEPFGNVVLEAMSYGCAVVTTAQCGASELLSDKYFILKNQNDTNAPKIVNDLLEKPELMNKFGLANIEISHNFTIERNAQLTLKVINAYIH